MSMGALAKLLPALGKAQTPLALALVALVAANEALSLSLSDPLLALALFLAGVLGVSSPKDAASRMAQAISDAKPSNAADVTQVDSGHECVSCSSAAVADVSASEASR